MIDINELAFFALGQQKRIQQAIYGIENSLYGNVGEENGPLNEEAVLHEKFLEVICDKIIDSQNPEAMRKAVMSAVDYIGSLTQHYKQATMTRIDTRTEMWTDSHRNLEKISDLLHHDGFLAAADTYYNTFQRLTKILEQKTGPTLTEKSGLAGKIHKP